MHSNVQNEINNENCCYKQFLLDATYELTLHPAMKYQIVKFTINIIDIEMDAWMQRSWQLRCNE